VFTIDLTHEYGDGDRLDQTFKCDTLDEAAGRIEDLTGTKFETARDDLSVEERLTYEEDGRVVTVKRIGALV
jgi:hypothetical protein